MPAYRSMLPFLFRGFLSVACEFEHVCDVFWTSSRIPHDTKQRRIDGVMSLGNIDDDDDDDDGDSDNDDDEDDGDDAGDDQDDDDEDADDEDAIVCFLFLLSVSASVGPSVVVNCVQFLLSVVCFCASWAFMCRQLHAVLVTCDSTHPCRHPSLLPDDCPSPCIDGMVIDIVNVTAVRNHLADVQNWQADFI